MGILRRTVTLRAFWRLGFATCERTTVEAAIVTACGVFVADAAIHRVVDAEVRQVFPVRSGLIMAIDTIEETVNTVPEVFFVNADDGTILRFQFRISVTHQAIIRRLREQQNRQQPDQQKEPDTSVRLRVHLNPSPPG